MDSGHLPNTINYFTLSHPLSKNVLLPPAYLRHAMRAIAEHPELEPNHLEAGAATPWLSTTAALDTMQWLAEGRRIVRAMSRQGQLLLVHGYIHGGAPDT